MKFFKIRIGNRQNLLEYLSLAKKRGIKFRWNQIHQRYEARKRIYGNKSIDIRIKNYSGYWRLHMHVDIIVCDVVQQVHKIWKNKTETNKIGQKYLEFKNFKHYE